MADQTLFYSALVLPVSVAFSKALAEVASTMLVLACLVLLALRGMPRSSGRIFAGWLILWLLVCLASALLASDPPAALRAWWRKTLEYAFVALAMWLVGRDPRRLERILTVIAWAAVVFILDGVVQSVIGHDLLRWRARWGHRLTGPLGDPNSFATYLSMVLPVQLWAAMTRTKRWHAIVLAGGILLVAWPLALTDSRIAWVACAVTLIWFVALTRKIFIIIPLLLLMVGLWRYGALSLAQFFQLSPGRTEAWTIAWRMFLDHPVTGIGHGAFMAHYMDYLPQHPSGTWPRPQYAHNCYLQLLAEGGILGLAAFLLVTGWVVVMAVRCLHCIREGRFSPLSGLLAGLGVFFMSITFDTGLYSLPIALLFWSFVGLTVGASERGARAEPSLT